MGEFGTDGQLANLIKRYTRKLNETLDNLLRMGNDQRMKSALRDLAYRTRMELGDLSREGCRVLETDGDRSRLERTREKAAELAAKSTKEFDDLAQGLIILARQNSRFKGLNSGATQVRGQIKDLTQQFTAIEAAVKARINTGNPGVKALNFEATLYLQDKRTFYFEVGGPLGMYAGLVVRHNAGKEYGGHLQPVEESGQNAKTTNRAMDLFKERVGEFKVENASELLFKMKTQQPGSSVPSAPLAWAAPQYYQFEQFETLQGIGFTLPGGNEKVKVSYTHRDFSGRFRLEIYVHQDRTILINGINNSTFTQMKIGEFVFDAIYQQGLESISSFSGGKKETKDGIEYFYDGDLALYQGFSENNLHHSESSHYGKPELNSKLREVGRLFGEKFPGGHIFLNDMNLPWGGAFKTGQQLGSGHDGHKTGDNADISYVHLTNNSGANSVKAQRVELDKIIQEVFSDTYYRFHGGLDQWHWHVSTLKSSKENIPMIEGFVECYKNPEGSKYTPEKFLTMLEEDGFFWDFCAKLGRIPKERVKKYNQIVPRNNEIPKIRY